MTQASRTGRARKGIGVTLIVIGVMLALVAQFILYSDTARTRLLFFLPVFLYLPWLLIPGGTFLFWRGRQYAAKADAERIITDSDPDVLYLRTFRSDPSTAGYVFWSSLTIVMVSGLATEEEQLADVLRPFGDLVAIGHPGERLPEPGAARIYTSDEEWKEVVKRQMQAARLVIIRAGVGENLVWELRKAVETLNPRNVLILVLQMKAKHYESFRATVKSVSNVSLPEGATLRYFGRVSGFIGFGAGWKPSVLRLPQLPYFRRSVYKPYRQLFKFALRPVFESFGLEWQPPPDVFWSNVIRVSLGLLFVIFAEFFGVQALIKFAAQR